VNKPQLSIVTPSFNQATYLAEALESVRQQKHPSVEHLVIDGGSKDGSVEILKECTSRSGWSHLRWISERDRGQSDAVNKGFRMASGELVGWLNSDDRYRAGCFDLVTRAAETLPGIEVLYGDYTWIDEAGELLQVRREIEFSRFILLYHKVLYVPTTSTFFRRRIFGEGNFLDESFHYAMDFEYFVRLALRGYRFQHVPGLFADFRWHSMSKSSLGAQKQRDEQDRVVEQVSPMLRNLHFRPLRRTLLAGARQVAGVRRYCEKLMRGYYVDQFIRRPRPRR